MIKESFMRKSLAGLAGMAMIAGISACGSSQPTAQKSSTTSASSSTKSSSGASSNSSSGGAAKGSPIVIPAILSETGGAAFLGKEEATALQALQKQTNANGGINGAPIQFKLLDNATNPKTAVQLAGTLIGKYPLILNGSITATAAAVDALANPSTGPLMYALTPGVHPKANSFIFSTTESTLSLNEATFNYLKAKGWTRVAAITSTDASGQDGWNQIQKVMAMPQFKNFKMLTHQTFATDAVSVSSQIDKIAAAKPQAVIVWSTGSPAEVVFKDLSQSPLANTPVFTTNGNQTYAQMHAWAQFLPKQLYYASAPWNVPPSQLSGSVQTAVQQFDAAFKAINVKPDIGQTLSWDPGKIFIHLLRTVGPHATAQQYLKALENLKGYAGVDGVYNFSNSDHRGLGISNVYVELWTPSKDTWVPVSGPKGIPTK